VEQNHKVGQTPPRAVAPIEEEDTYKIKGSKIMNE